MRSADYGDRTGAIIVGNSGFVIAAVDISVDEQRQRSSPCFDSSIINGAQSQGEIRKYLSDITIRQPSS